MVMPETAPRIELGPTQLFIFPSEFAELTLPEFPEGISPNEVLDLTVCLSFTVNEFGETVDVSSENTTDPACMAPESRPSLVAAAVNAVESWEFLAAAICDYDTPEQRRADDESCAKARSVTPAPVRLAWAFRFKADGNRRSVLRAVK